MPTSAEGKGGRRLALIVATASYGDPTLAKLRAPGRDASDLAAVLGDAAIGGFEVETVLDAPAETMRRRIAHFCTQIGPRDLALVYLSCHGVLDDRGRLYYATADTDRALLSATALPSAWLNEQLEDCRSRRQILVLDCCHSGAFAKGAKGEGELALRERFEGRGRVVLTGSRGTEYSFEHDDVIGDSVSSVFTSALVEGLRNGDADRDGDGMVTVGELYDYAYETVRTKEVRQTPTLWAYGAEGDLLVAQSPRGPIVKPVPLPEDLVVLLESARPRVREGAVAELAELMRGSDAGRALTAREALERVAATDAPKVAAAARAALEAAPADGPTRARQPSTPSAPPSAPKPRKPSPPPTPPKPPGADASGGPPESVGPKRFNRRPIVVGAVALGIAVVIGATLAILTGGSPAGPETIEVGGVPGGIAVDGSAWVAQRKLGKATRVKSASDTEAFEVGPEPATVAAGEGTAWVAYDERRKLVRIFPEAEEPPEIDLREICECKIGQLAMANDSLWVSSKEGETVTRYDPQTGKEIENFSEIDGFEGAFALDNNAIWAVGVDEAGSGGKLTRVDIALGDHKEKFHEPNSTFEGVAYGDERVWISDTTNNRVIAFKTDTEETKVAHFDKTGLYPGRIVFADDLVLVLDPWLGLLNRIDAETGERIDPVSIDHYTKEDEVNENWSNFSVGDEFAWITDPAKNLVHKIRYDGT